MTKMVCIAGFGDNGSMFYPLLTTELAKQIEIRPFDLPGFGKPALSGDTTLASLADVLDAETRTVEASVVVAHSVGSIIASLAAQKAGSPIRTILSLEGNLTAEDAYFSGTAADYDSSESFRAAFLQRLSEMAEHQPIISRYREMVAGADQNALWQLGRDARRFSAEKSPGKVLIEAAMAVYFYNPANVPDSSLKWLETHDILKIRMDDTSHWPSVDQPDLLAKQMTEVLTQIGHIS